MKKYDPDLLRKCYDECFYEEGMPVFDELNDEQKEYISNTLAYAKIVIRDALDNFKDVLKSIIQKFFV